MMRPIAVGLVASILACAGSGLRAAQPAELRTLFPHEANVEVEREGLSRLVLPPEILTACRSDLADVRLFDAEGREVAYLVDRASSDESYAETRFAAPVLELTRSEERRESGPPLRREVYDLGLAQETLETGSWVLVFETAERELVASVRVSTLDVAGNVKLLETGSVFHLIGPRAASRLRLLLPPFEAERLRVELLSEERSWIEPSFSLQNPRTIERTGRLSIPLETIAVRSAEGKTVIDLARPYGIVPDLLRIETATPTFDRRVEVWDDGPGAAAAALGAADLFRVEGIASAGIDELALTPPHGDRLRIEIQDGDSPALDAMRWTAVVRQPALVFSARGSVTLRFGGGRAHRPRYDLQGLLPRHATGERAKVAEALASAATLAAAKLGEVRPNPHYDGAAVLAFAMRPGAEIDRRLFRHVRRLRVPEAPEGLSRLVLAPEDLAAVEADLADLRVADSGARQWPFLIERDAGDALVPLRLEGPTTEDRTSRYVLKPPVAWIELDRLVLDSDAAFFDRSYRLLDVSGKEERALAAGRLVRPIGDPRPVAVGLPSTRVSSLVLVIEDGDDAPLELRSIEVRTSAPELYLTAPAGDYDLLLGAAEVAPPRYELERVRDVVLAVRWAEIAPGALEDNPDFSLTARLEQSGLRQTVLLWAVLIVAVVALGTYTLRLARRAS